MRTVQATRYVTPLREGGSLPGLVEADDDGLYVLKFRGAGQGAKALVAELVAGELARAAGLPVPEIVFVELDPELGRAEPDPEIQELIAASGGLNVGLDFLPGSLTYNPAAGPPPDPELAAEIVWLDALTTNVDRSPQNPNLLLWHGRIWLIDHGAALYLQHAWEDPPAEAQRPFPAIRNHVLLPCAGDIARGRRAARAAARRRRRRSAHVPGRLVRAARPRAPTPSTCAGGSRRRAASPPRPRRRAVPPSPFQYAIVRVVPHVERGECVNAGVVLFCRPRRFLAARVELDEERLRAHRARRRPRRRPRPPRRARADRRGRARRPARSPRCPRPSASTGSSPRRARSSSARPSTRASATTPRRSWSAWSTDWCAR